MSEILYIGVTQATCLGAAPYYPMSLDATNSGPRYLCNETSGELIARDRLQPVLDHFRCTHVQLFGM
jgi:hypothetical protein